MLLTVSQGNSIHLNKYNIEIAEDEGGDRGYITLCEQQCSPTWLFIENSSSLQTDASCVVSHNKSQAEQDRKHLGVNGSGRLSDMNEMP